MPKTKGFFAENASRLSPLCIEGKAKYRKCQVGAAWATLAHFTSSSEAALISMPTGSGKTALMMILSLLLEVKRVIIVSPSVVLRQQTAEKFSNLNDLKSINAYPKAGPTPNVHDHEGQVSSDEQWRKFLKYDVITVTPHTISPGYEEVSRPPEGLFGAETLLFVDEAHHSRARTWQTLIEAFASSPVVFFTATPFRNDNRRMLARLIYHYSMKKALEAGIYAPISYHAVEPTDGKDKDVELSKAAFTIYKKQKRKHPHARLLIRAEGVTESGRLLSLYRQAGLKVEEVNYKKTLQDNSAALQGIRCGDLDGIVCIDQIGEGIDIPNLKIAVLHKPRQSFPATVQFIGRISREQNSEIGEPHLIACPDDVRGPLQRLYTHDNSWRDFVPKLVDQIIGKASRRSEFHEIVDADTELDLAIEDIEPFFSARVYQGGEWNVDNMLSGLDLPAGIVPAYAHEIASKNMLVIITATEKRLPWADKADLSLPSYDLHLYYLSNTAKLLFEYTTSDKIGAIIRSLLWSNSLERIHASQLSKALRESQTSQYLMFGLSNITLESGSVPSYKTYMGTAVEGAIRPVDARSFVPGHALAKYASGETRGVGTFQGRIWSIKRGSLNEFRDWCDSVAVCIRKKGDSRLPNVEFLPSPEAISAFPYEPLAMFWRPESTVELSWQLSSAGRVIKDVSYEKIELSIDRKSIHGQVEVRSEADVIIRDFTYTLSVPAWTLLGEHLPLVRIDDGEQRQTTDFAGLMDRNPPIIVLEDGSSVIGGSRYVSKSTLPAFPMENFDSGRDWSKCDIHVEFEYRDPVDTSKSRIPKRGMLSIHDQLEKWLTRDCGPKGLLIKDHGSGEIADFITIDALNLKIGFYHCKACSGRHPGARIADLKALEQALRSINYIGNRSLMVELSTRVSGTDRPSTKLIKGDKSILKQIESTFQANQWKFEIVLVNPGIKSKSCVRSANVNTLLLSCLDWLAAAGANMRVLGQ